MFLKTIKLWRFFPVLLVLLWLSDNGLSSLREGTPRAQTPVPLEFLPWGASRLFSLRLSYSQFPEQAAFPRSTEPLSLSLSLSVSLLPIERKFKLSIISSKINEFLFEYSIRSFFDPSFTTTPIAHSMQFESDNDQSAVSEHLLSLIMLIFCYSPALRGQMRSQVRRGRQLTS